MLELARRFEVEAEYPELQRACHFGVGFAHAGEHDPRRIRAGSDRARKLAARHDVEAAAQAREQVDDRQIRVGFHRVADQVGQAGECAIERRKGVFDRGAGIDEARSAVLRGDFSERNALGGELAVAIVERGHCLPAPDDPGAVGGSAGGGEDGVDDGGGVVSGAPGPVVGGAAGLAAGLAGGSFSGPLMPHDVSASAAMHAMATA